MATTLDAIRNNTIPNIITTPHLLNLDAQASNHVRIINTPKMFARQSWSTTLSSPSPRTLNHASTQKMHPSFGVKHATRCSCLKITCKQAIFNNMESKDGKEDHRRGSRLIAKCEMEPKGREPSPGHDDQQHGCGDKKYTKRDHSPGHDENQCGERKSCHKRGESKPGSEWHDIFHGELREWKGTRGSKYDEHCDEDPCHEYTQHGGCEDESRACSSLNATYKGHKTSLFPMTSYGPNFYAPIGTAVFHYHFGEPSQSCA